MDHLDLIALGYQYVLKPALFRLDAEAVHENTLSLAQALSQSTLTRNLSPLFIPASSPRIAQTIAGIHFPFPLGLAAGFDYMAKLTQTLPLFGFGFHTIGTITNLPYKGNARPRLGRLPNSQALMVNKGFKNLGAKKTVAKLAALSFPIPIGISIGRTNLPQIDTLDKAINDIVASFKIFEAKSLKHSYYELNISCPNLYGNVTFYEPKNLQKLIRAVKSLKTQRPIFVKMPITKTDDEILRFLQIIVAEKLTGVIFGNLQTNRLDPSLDQTEVNHFARGNFSGKPTEKRSNELISLAHQKYGRQLIIIGCGGVFTAYDAYKKIRLGASLVQLITGLVFQGPQLVAQINRDLVKLLDVNHYHQISEAIGKKC
ncbi:MAG: dihydroorotate dehydrogenase 2, nonfunctional [Microgenomates group bacterium GW2011_GWA1_48_10]|uniref:Dihydroorotate dehydrogenase (quinone) n=1 Tax=Candidatus Gottesmanbacteria bacterium RIFCSPHIGHO2_01_FULL_47_48 TaxID=1798381 RepID=A0A1F6A5R3_9BACT|nr:MAG: dihydroorotate dehydrogenase 2, nonfunctional [Microgenomates group bacterium GW2011_GWA1_48_10]OGG19617.1 MAG: dihydroorotate dehydrogenase (quinone) [Candidatus Gottesmanbacteria bacterium RIFCSPHIGHO2_01_FULL_47_48]